MSIYTINVNLVSGDKYSFKYDDLSEVIPGMDDDETIVAIKSKENKAVYSIRVKQSIDDLLMFIAYVTGDTPQSVIKKYSPLTAIELGMDLVDFTTPNGPTQVNMNTIQDIENSLMLDTGTEITDQWGQHINVYVSPQEVKKIYESRPRPTQLHDDIGVDIH